MGSTINRDRKMAKNVTQNAMASCQKCTSKQHWREVEVPRGLVGTCPIPTSCQNQFSNSSKFDEKMSGYERGSFKTILKWV